ncbi:MAG TPA: PEGA domain-containing protein [Kofleriaceae bacterium]|nr:PEGA domain-containing protein [Kofleriaceae bacterium]
MTSGPPLYLVSACGSAEEFVAAFRRYADRTGLFVPSAAPLPAGRRGRLALTLKDGGVMIEGEAEILQSSAKPTVLHGRPGMTVKFIEPDEPSKVVIGELEKARLAMKPAPPSVPPRPADIPAQPRPVVPAPSGRIDAANALAECVVIGDPATLIATANAPRPAGDSKFAVPSIPAVGTPRPKTPSAPPEMRPKTPSTPPEMRPKTPTAPPDPTATPLPAPKVANNSGKLTSIGFPAIDKMPAKTESGRVVSNATTLGMPALDRKPDPMLSPQRGTPAAANPTSPPLAAPSSAPSASAPVTDGKPARPDATPPKFIPNTTVPGTGAPDNAATKPLTVHDEQTTIGEGPPKRQTDPIPATIPAKPLFDPIGEDEATAIGAVPPKKVTDPMPTTAPPTTAPPTPTMQATPVAAAREPSAPTKVETPRSELSKQHKATSIGFPVVGRNVFETQPLGIVPPANPAKYAAETEPQPPTLPKSTKAQQPAAPRGKAPTTPPLTPRHPTPVAPVPIVRMPSKAAPSAAPEDEPTDIGNLPTVTAPVDVSSPSDSGAIVQTPPARSGGMRASEILAAIPAGDWTMSPDESVPHALPPEAKVAAVAPPSEPTPAPAPPPKGPPTGDWTIQLDPAGGGWSEPEKVDKAESATAGNPVLAVASEKPLDVVQWDEKPTGIGESKIEIDSTLMEAKALPDDEPAQIVSTKPQDLPPPLEPMPPRRTGVFADPGAYAQQPYRPSATDIVTYPAAPQDAAKKKKMLLLAIAAGLVAVGAIVMLVLTLGGAKKKAASTTGTGAASGKMTVTPPPAVDAPAAVTPPQGSGSQQVAVAPAGSGSETAAPAQGSGSAKPEPTPPVASGPCKVDVKSLPTGADIYVDSKKLGTTPDTIDLPCGTESKLSLKKKSFPNTLRAFTPTAGKANKLLIKLTRTLVSVKVTSTPAGATITAGGKSMGVTPTTIKLPQGEPTAITLSKPGYAKDTQKVSPRSGASHHVTLKKGK